jgi:hypothetical protein
MKKIIGLVVATMLLSACSAIDTAASAPETSGGMIVMNTAVRTMEEAVPITDVSRVIAPYYYTTWDYCMIDGTRIDNVSFTWTDLGMAMVIGSEVIYRPNLTERITECRGTLTEG